MHQLPKGPEPIKERLTLLYCALCYSRQVEPLFTPADRMMINQERGSLLAALEYPETEIKAVSPKIESKINEVKNYIGRTGWQPLNPDPFEWNH